jgi:FixJ family two-component response regulator
MFKENVYLVDDNPEVRFHLKGLLVQKGYSVHEFDGAQAFIEILEKIEHPCVLLVDMRMPKLSGLDLQHQLKMKNIFIPIIFISGESQHQEIIDAMKNGAIEFLWKPFQSEHLITAIRRGLAMDIENTNTQRRKIKLQALQADLSPRENEIFLLIHKGLGNKEIGERLGIFSDTVKKHRAQVLAKMQVANLHELLQIWQGIDPSSRTDHLPLA